MGKIKLVATDIDGTLLREYGLGCSEEAVELMNELIRRGVYVVPASGRQLPNLKRLFADVKGELMYLCENGALVSYGDRVVLKRHFSRELAMELAHMVIDRPGCEVTLSGERVNYIIPKTEGFRDYLVDVVKYDVAVIDSPEEIREPIMKVSCFTRKEELPGAAEYFKGVIDGRCSVMLSGAEWVDFAPHNASKGDALRELGEKLGIGLEEMAAFGDNENDRTMLECVGHPYLMKKCNPCMEGVPAVRVERVEDELKKILEGCERD